MSYVIVLGNAVQGLSFVGPFRTHTDATDYSAGYIDDDWIVEELHTPAPNP